MDRIRYSVMTRLAPYPSLALPLAPLRGEGELVGARTDLLVESYPRSASSFAVAAFRVAQEPRSVRIAHHTHAAGHVIAAVMTRRFDAEAPSELRRRAERLHVRFTGGIAR